VSSWNELTDSLVEQGYELAAREGIPVDVAMAMVRAEVERTIKGDHVSDTHERIRIVEAIDLLCEQLGIEDKSMVRELLIRPTHVEVELYLPAEGGGKLTEDGEAVTRRESFEVWS